METVQKIRKLMENSNAISELFKRKVPIWNSDRSRYDKVGWGFNEDSRFNSCDKPLCINFSSWAGVYGNSGCSTQLHVDGDIFNSHLLKVLNRKKEEIMLAVADSIKDEARQLKEKAEIELRREREKLAELDEVLPSSLKN